MIGSGLNSIKHRKDKQLTETSTVFKEIPKDSLSSLKIIKIETSTVNEPFSKIITQRTTSNSPKSTSLSSSPSSSPQPSTVITSIQVSPNHHHPHPPHHHSQRSQCYITTYTPYRDLIRTNVINMVETPTPLPPLNKTTTRPFKSSPNGEPSVTSISSSSPSPSIIGTVSSSSSSSALTKISRNGRSGSKKNGRWTFTNCRERQRQQNVNEAFQELRSKIPTQPVDKKLSKCSILTRAIEYIKLLNGILEKMDDEEEEGEGEDEDDEGDDCPSSSLRKRSRYSSNEIDGNQIHCKSSSRNSVLTSSSSSSIHDYESDGAGGEEEEEEEDEEEEEERLEDEDIITEKDSNGANGGDRNRKKEKKISTSRVSSCPSNANINRPNLETNVSITRVNANLKGSQSFNQINDRRLNCPPIVTRSSTIGNHRQRSFCRENIYDGLSQDSQETLRSSEDKMIMDDVSLVSYEFDSSREQSISSTVSSPSDSD